MNKLQKVLMAVSSAVIVRLVGKAVVLEEAVLSYLMTFFFVGAGLAGLRLFINAMIGKMKGKNIFVKIGFFAGLLSVGLPFQNWFRTEVIFAMDKAFMVPSITVLASSVVLMTIVYGIIINKVKLPQLEEEQVVSA